MGHTNNMQNQVGSSQRSRAVIAEREESEENVSRLEREKQDQNELFHSLQGGEGQGSLDNEPLEVRQAGES